ncbi:MAG: NAD-dependent epimerase/dehydratase family protein [Candidatus Hodarchaeota archaeon]
MKNILLTGITGFIGSHMARELVMKNYQVYGTVRYMPNRNLKTIEDFLDKIVLLNNDITDILSVNHIMKISNPDYVIHLAALSPVRYSFQHPYQYAHTNYLGTMNLIHAMTNLPDFKSRKLYVASTAEVYGLQPEEPFKESLSLKPTSPYAVSKAAADMYTRMAAKVYDIDCTVMRPTNTYGRKYQTGFIIEYLITTMLRDKPVYIGAPDSIRDYIYVSDHIQAYLTAIEKDHTSGEAFNIGSGYGITNRDLAQKIAKIINYSGKISLGAYPPGYPIRPIISDQPYLVLDSTKIQKELGWKPKISLDQGLKNVVNYWREKIK